MIRCLVFAKQIFQFYLVAQSVDLKYAGSQFFQHLVEVAFFTFLN